MLTLPSETLWLAPHRWPSEEDSFHDIAGTEMKYVLTYLDEPTQMTIIASSITLQEQMHVECEGQGLGFKSLGGSFTHIYT